MASWLQTNHINLLKVSIIQAIIQELPLGKHKREIGLYVRKTLFLNSVLFHSEIYHSFKEFNIAELKLNDSQILRLICSAKTPVEFFVFESGSLSLSHKISQRRIIHLNKI